MQNLPKIGDRLVVHGMTTFKSIVSSIEWDLQKYDWRIELDWQENGKSRVWAHDEHIVWYRWNTNN